jgi:hypothetical protein
MFVALTGVPLLLGLVLGLEEAIESLKGIGQLNIDFKFFAFDKLLIFTLDIGCLGSLLQTIAALD